MENKVVIEFLLSLKRNHLIHDDCWYSCPLSGECCNDYEDQKNKCTCGALEFNEKIDNFVEKLNNGSN